MTWNHEVVNKQNVKSESGFLKTNAKSGSTFYPDVGIYQFLSIQIEILSKCVLFP